MTLGECIRRCDALRPNTASEEEKAQWVLEVEEELERAFFPGYQGAAPVREARRWPEDRAGRLLASGAFEGFYLFRLLARLELMDQEWTASDVHSGLANQLESAFRKDWARRHRRKTGGGVKL